mmetsp:Transcript_62932/g.185866  ORF Transcript_62932/g.185866 Transcript_62932/m.185866 type:complete len:200 (-) Transcript_62932:1935-2534(-)
MEAQFPRGIEIVAHYRIPHRVLDRTSHRIVARDHVHGQSESLPLVVLAHDPQTIGTRRSRDLDGIERNEGGGTDPLIPQILHAIVRRLLVVHDHGVHILPGGDRHSQVESTLGRTAQIDQSTLHARKVTAEGADGLEHPLLLTILPSIVPRLAELGVDRVQFRVDGTELLLLLLGRLLDGLEGRFGLGEFGLGLFQALL